MKAEGSIDEKQPSGGSARRLVSASQKGSSSRRAREEKDRMSKTLKPGEHILGEAGEPLLPAISNRSISKQSQAVAGSQGSAPQAQRSALKKSTRGSSAKLRSQRRPSETPRGSVAQGQPFQKSYQLAEHVAEQQANQIMSMSQRSQQKQGGISEKGSIGPKTGASLAGSRAGQDQSQGGHGQAGPSDLNLADADLLDNLAVEDVGGAAAYQTQPVHSSGGTERAGDLQFHPPPPDGRSSKGKGVSSPGTGAASKLSKSSVFKEKKKLPKVNAWEHFEVNQFKVRNQEPGQIIARLQQLTASDIPFQGELPPDDDMDSTDPLDSFMYAFVKIVNDRSINWTTEVRRGIHLATHTRTDFCEKMLTFICHHQKLEQAFRDCVDFFMESLTNLVRLEDENKRMNAEIESLLNLKEDSIVVKFKLEQRLKEQLQNSEKIQKREQQANAKITQLQKLMADKNAECESLQYRLQHFQEIGVGMDAPGTQNAVRQSTGGGAVPNPAEDESTRAARAAGMEARASTAQSGTPLDGSKLRELQMQNQRLEEEVQELREALAKQDHSNHFQKIQSLFNKIQIENKNLRIYNQKCESKLESRQTLIDRLQNKLSSEMGNYKEKIVALEAEIKVLTNKNRQNEERTQNMLQAQQKKLEADFKQKHDDKIKDLEGEVADNEKQKADLRRRMERIQREHEELSNEFRSFRTEKEEQEAEYHKQYEALEKKIVKQQSVDEEKIHQLNKQIDEQENKSEVLEKENTILVLRQKYLKQHTEMLHKQKLFLESTLLRGKAEIWENLKIIEKKILEDNNNENFLISIRKCFEYANQVAGMGSNVLENISQILSFLKIEKLHSLLCDAEELEALEQTVQQTLEESHQNQKASIVGKLAPNQKTGQLQKAAAGEAQAADGIQIQRLLNQIGAGTDASPQLSISRVSGAGAPRALGSPGAGRKEGAQTSAEKAESFYLKNHPIELASTCMKLQVDTLVQLGAYSSVTDLPMEVNQLLEHCNAFSNPEVENEIMNRFFGSTKDVLQGAIENIKQSYRPAAADIPEPLQLREKSSQKKTQDQAEKSKEEQRDETQLQQEYQMTTEKQASGKRSSSPGGSASPEEAFNIDAQAAGGLQQQRQEVEDMAAKMAEQELQFLIDKQKLEIETYKNKLDKQKIKARDLQLNLAGKIVVLEEQIEKMNTEKEEQIKQLEQAHSEELQRATQGVEQREAQLVQLCDEYREDVRDLQRKLETSWRPAEESKTIQKMEQGTRGNLYKLMKDQYETKFKESQELLQNYQASINEFVYLREDLRGSFTLAFDCAKLPSGVLNMINESMLRYYLSKTFLIDKSKFRFLRSEELSESLAQKQHQGNQPKPQRILKLVIEVVAHDAVTVSQLFKNVKAQIKDGTSLLYDFMPLYFGMNLGSSGFSTHHNLRDFALLSKTGQNIEGVEYIVSVLRHKQNPLIFKVIAFNLELREEFMMELNESDVYELVEGNQQILKNVEPDELIQKITTNLNLIERDRIKVLTCDQKIFFNEIWMENMESGKNFQEHRRSPMEADWQKDTHPGELAQKVLLPQSPITHTAARRSQLSRSQPKLVNDSTEFVQKFNENKESQTDFPIADLYEGYETAYRGVQKVGDVTHMRLFIKQSTKTSTLIFEFDDLTSLKKLKFSLYTKDAEDHYVIHTECMKITDGHHVLISIEQIQKEGIMIRMFDLLECKALTLSLLRKQNGQYARLPDDSQLDLLQRQDFRNFLYELQLHVNKQANETIMRSYAFLFRQEAESAKKSARTLARENEQKKQVESKKRDVLVSKISAGKSLPRRKRAQYAQRVISFSQRAYYKDKWTERQRYGVADPDGRPESPSTKYSNQIEGQSGAGNQLDWRDSPGEKGTLLYRNVYHVRWVTNGSDPEPRESVITLYIKEQVVQMEVLLYQDPAKMSIGSKISAVDLFGEDPLSMPFKDRVNHLNNMMEKFFITSIDSFYHMKVESESIPINQFLAELEEGKKVKGKGDSKAQGVDTMVAQQHVQEIQNRKGKNSDEVWHSRHAKIDGEMHEVEMLFRKKARAKTERTGKHGAKKSNFGKSGAEKTQADIEQYLDEFCFWDSIYFEVTDSQNEKISTLYEKKKIAFMLAKDEFLDWRATLTNYDPLLLDYIQRSIKLDKEREEVSLHNTDNIEQKIFEKYRKQVGGSYHKRKDLDLSEDETKLVNKLMICNLEVEFSEFLYDIKIYELQRLKDKDIISYQIEIFMLHEPEVAYLYNYPMNSASHIQDPHTLVIEEFNLIDNALKRGLELEKKNKPGQKKGMASGQNIAARNHSSKAMDLAGSSTGVGSTAQAKAEQANQLQKSIDRKQDIQRDLFRKYIDNRVVLLVQEQRFPRKLDFILVEPCSQLIWRHHIEPRLITTGLGSMHLVDQATVESFLAVLIDEAQTQDPSQFPVFEYESSQATKRAQSPDRIKTQELQAEGTMTTKTIVQNFNWIQGEDAIFVKDLEILEDDFKLSIEKLHDSFSVLIEKIQLGKQSLDQQSVNDIPLVADAGEDEQNQLLLRIKPLEGNTVLARVIRVRGLNYSMLFVRVLGNVTTIKIVELKVASIVTVFKLQFVHEEKMGNVPSTPGGETDRSEQERLRQSQQSDRQTFTTRDMQRSILDAIRRFYGSQFIDQGMRIYEKQKALIERENDAEYEEPTIFERMDDDKPSIHLTRTATRQLLEMDTRTVVLHRKAYFDDQLEKLILMQIRLRLDSSEYLNFRMEQEPEGFSIVLMEPDSTNEVEFSTPLSQCLTQEEMFFDEQRLKDLRMLRRLAKRVLEDRVQINRVQHEPVQPIQSTVGGDPMQEGDGADMELNSDLKPFADGAGGLDDGIGGSLLKNYRLDINFDRDRITNLDNRSASAHADSAHRSGGPQMQNYEHTSGFYGEVSGPGGNIGSADLPDSSSHQIPMMQHRSDMGDAYQQAAGGPGAQAYQRGPSGGANYGNNQSTILEAASNEEDGDQVVVDENESLEQFHNVDGTTNRENE